MASTGISSMRGSESLSSESSFEVLDFDGLGFDNHYFNHILYLLGFDNHYFNHLLFLLHSGTLNQVVDHFTVVFHNITHKTLVKPFGALELR